MPQTYRAILDGDRVEWIDSPPTLDGPTPVEITILRTETEEERRARGRRAAEALQALADAGGISSIEDPVAWQREIRRDRPLPGRED
jgi:hypothetical protein